MGELPDETIVDGEIVALDDSGRPSFNLLQKFVSEAGRTRYFVFDLLCHKGRDLTGLPLIERREILGTLAFQSQWVKIADYFEASSDKPLRATREQQLEGIVGKLRDSHYEPGKRSGAWIKYHLNLGQEFVIGGYTPGPHGLDAIIRKLRLISFFSPYTNPEAHFPHMPYTRGHSRRTMHSNALY